MSQYKDVATGSTVYFWFASNNTTGSADDGSAPVYDVRLAGAAASAAPVASGTPELLTHANYTDGLYEIAIDTTGFDPGEYAVFCSLTISATNPAGFVGSFAARVETLYQVALIASDLLDQPDGVEIGWTLRQALRVILASAAGDLAGAAGPTVTIDSVTGAKTRITAPVDGAGNRTGVTYDVSD